MLKQRQRQEGEGVFSGKRAQSSTVFGAKKIVVV